MESVELVVSVEDVSVLLEVVEVSEDDVNIGEELEKSVELSKLVSVGLTKVVLLSDISDDESVDVSVVLEDVSVVLDENVLDDEDEEVIDDSGGSVLEELVVGLEMVLEEVVVVEDEEGVDCELELVKSCVVDEVGNVVGEDGCKSEVGLLDVKSVVDGTSV